MDGSSATLKDLTSALHDTLKYNGSLSALQASARSSIHSCLESTELTPPSLPNENLIVNELVLEYLKFNGYGHTASVMRAETGQPKEGTVEAGFLRSELGIKGGTKVREEVRGQKGGAEGRSDRLEGRGTKLGESHDPSAPPLTAPPPLPLSSLYFTVWLSP